MTPIHDVISKGQVVRFDFAQSAVTASQAAVALKDLAAANSGYTMPFDYEVIAASFNLSAAGTTGAATVDVTVGGTANTGATVTFGTATGGYVRVNREKIRGLAGDVLGAKVTTASGWDATTAKLTYSIYVIQKLRGI